MKYFLIFSFLLGMDCFSQTIPQSAQTDWQRWGKAIFSYQIPNSNNGRDYSFEGKNVGDVLLKTTVDAYWFFISDEDGDNCSFRPTCSSFFVKSVEETNIFQGILMFSDRLTRDTDLLKLGSYPRVKDGHFYDPPILYQLNERKIKYIPPNVIVNYESALRNSRKMSKIDSNDAKPKKNFLAFY
jgi:putative component of membrane protein insertase Oxa1/YidC/SpoIIIJ protein YidD